MSERFTGPGADELFSCESGASIMRIHKKLSIHTARRSKNAPVYLPSRYEIKGKRIIGTSPILLPDICVKCGSEGRHGRRVNETMSCGNPLLWLLVFFFNVLAVAIIYLFTKNKVQVSYFMCDKCRAQIHKRKNINCAVWLATIASFAAAVFLGGKTLWIVFFILCVVGIITLAVSRYPIDVDAYENGKFYLRGFSRSYIDKLC
jgi:hypothetical protein